jgi:subtilisin family serine protease
MLIAGGISAIEITAIRASETTLDRPVTIYTGTPEANAIVTRAQQKGRIRVIVGLRITMQPQHAISSAAAEQQSRALQTIQSRVATRVLGQNLPSDAVKFDFIPYMSLFVNAAQAARLVADPDVVSVQEDVPQPPLDTDTVPLIHADDVWSKSRDGTGYKIAVLDTGVQKTHPVLSGKVVSEACYSTNNGANIRSTCPGQATSSIAAGSGVNCSTTISGCDHGTHVASIAAAKQTADEIGIAKGAQLIAVKVFTRFNLASDCGSATAPCALSYSTDQISALQRVYALRTTYTIAAVNMSLGGGQHNSTCDTDNPALTTAIKNLRAVKIAVLIASGNNGFTGAISSPACVSYAIAVGNSTKDDLVAKSSNHSSLVKLLAPGSNIFAAVPGSAYGTKTGTSMATPAVAGAFAVLRQAKPGSSVDTLLTALGCTGKTIDHRNTTNIPAISPALPRIDLIGAYNNLIKPSSATRTWFFSTADEALDWTPYIGTWAIGNGRYLQSPIKQGWIATSVDNCNSSLTVTASMTRIDPGTTFFSNTGVLVKTSLNYDTHTMSGYWFAYNKCPTNVSGTCTASMSDPPGQAVIWRIDNADWLSGSGSGTLLCQHQASGVHVNGFNLVKVTSDGPSHTFELNGTQVCTANDATYTAGPVFAAAYIADAGGHAYQVNTMSIASHGDGASPVDEPINPASFKPKSTPPGMSPAGAMPTPMLRW